ncbi:MAG: hypothetical protein WAV18_05145 [Roseiarcus sp.]
MIGHPDLSASFSYAPGEFGDFRPYGSRIAEDDGLNRRDGLIPVQDIEIIGIHSSPMARSSVDVKTRARAFGSIARARILTD